MNNCPICHSDKIKLHSHPLYKQCLECSAIFQFSHIEPVDDYYSSIKIDYSYQLGSYKSYLNIVSKVIDLTNPEINLVDIGAGDGTFLMLCKQKYNFQHLFAVEASKTAKKVLSERGFKVISQEQIRQVGHPKVIVLLQVLEHLSKPQDFLKSINLQKGDYVVLTSPAVDSIYCKLYKNKWNSLSPSHHLILYSQKSLEVFAQELSLNLVYLNFCFSACHGSIDNGINYLKSLFKFPVKVLLGQKPSFPLFHGKNSFLAVLFKEN